jgi:hypothetical protein
MKLSNFVPTRTIGANTLTPVFFALVDVTTTTGHLWWKKEHRVTRDIMKRPGECWFFVDTGEYTPGFQVETLERSFRAQALLTEAK